MGAWRYFTQVFIYYLFDSNGIIYVCYIHERAKHISISNRANIHLFKILFLMFVPSTSVIDFG